MPEVVNVEYDGLVRGIGQWISDHPKLDAQGVVIRRADASLAVVEDRRAEWTNALLNALAEMGRGLGFVSEPTRVYFSRDGRGQGHNSRVDRPQRADDSGEFMTDLSWWKPAATGPWWDQPASEPLSCELIVESEWGWMEGGKFDHHVQVVASDFSKLLYGRSKLRLFLTSCTLPDRARFLDILSRLRARSSLSQGEVCVLLWDHSDCWPAAPSTVFP